MFRARRHDERELHQELFRTASYHPPQYLAVAMQLKALLLPLLQSFVLVSAQDAQQPLTSVPANDTLLWGPYRPNLYFGVRPRIPKSLLTGLMWVNADDFRNAQESKLPQFATPRGWRT